LRIKNVSKLVVDVDMEIVCLVSESGIWACFGSDNDRHALTDTKRFSLRGDGGELLTIIGWAKPWLITVSMTSNAARRSWLVDPRAHFNIDVKYRCIRDPFALRKTKS
jgi:hypothetical protein